MAGAAGNGGPPGKRPNGPGAQPPGGRSVSRENRSGPPPAAPKAPTNDPVAEPQISGRGVQTPIASTAVGSPTPAGQPTSGSSGSTTGTTGTLGLPARSDAALDGTLASYLERVASRTAAAFGVQAVAIALVGDDRRCFVGGTAPPPWLIRDPGILIRSRACAAVLETGESIAVGDAGVAAPPTGGSVAAALRVPAYMIAPLPKGANDRPAGVLCVFASEPRTWTPDELRALAEHAGATAPALAMRRRLGMGERGVQRTRREGLHDPLTGLPNRVLFMERLAQAIARNRREPAPFAVILLDLDHFRTINESLGHAAGDTLLVAVAQRLLDCSRAGDTAARLGADEFALLIHRVTHAADAARVAERVQEGLAAPIDLDGYEV